MNIGSLSQDRCGVKVRIAPEKSIGRYTMTFILMAFGYLLLIALLLRFFQTMHRWDEEISSMTIEGEVQAEPAPRTKAA